jgi:FkbM family methyltransferase
MSVLDNKAAFLANKIGKKEFIERMFSEHKNLYRYSELLKSSDIASIRIERDRIVFESGDGVKIASSNPDQRSAPIEALNFGAYEPEETAIMLQVINDGDLILDIGGNIGWFSILLAKRFPNSEILSFEPVGPVFDELKANIDLNECRKVTAYNLGLSDSEGEFDIFYDPTYSARSSTQDLSDGASRKVVCRTVTLDAFAAKHGLRPVQVIKCDVEGAELFVIRGGLGLIERDKPAIFAEMLRKWAGKFGYHPNDIIALLKPLGYRCFELKGDIPSYIGAVTDDTVGTNFLFLHPETRGDWIAQWTSQA